MKVLLTGASGFIGQKLLEALINKDLEVFALVRNPQKLYLQSKLHKKLHIISGDLSSLESIEKLPDDLDYAYFLVHGMQTSNVSFTKQEATMARNFLKILSKTNVQQIVYLSGLITKKNLSFHLASRLNVENILRKGTIPVTILRAGIVIGSGGISFEIMRNLVEKLPLMIAPKWVKSTCQPISLYDVLTYLIEVLGHKMCYNKIFDVGCDDVLTYKEMLLEFAKFRKLKRIIIDIPLLTPRLSSYWIFFVTPANFTVARWLVDSLTTNAICTNFEIKKIFPRKCMSYKESLKNIFSKIEETILLSPKIVSSSFLQIPPSLEKYIKVPIYGCFKDTKKEKYEKNREKLLETIWEIGGNKGWYAYNFLWKIRGSIDKIFKGVGMREKIQASKELQVGDIIDFWRVLLSDKKRGRLILIAEMRLPGEAWLEFEIQKEKDHYILYQCATFRPRGLLGRLYWYILLPIHHAIFSKMCKTIVRKATLR